MSALRFLSIVAAVAAFPAVAADRAPRLQAPDPGPSYSWAGFTFGGHLGYHNAPTGGNLSGYTGYSPGFFELNGIRKFDLDPKGLVGGVQIGAQTQIDRWVVGAEADVSLIGHTAKGQSAASNTSSVATLSLTHTETLTAKSQINWLGTFRARLGYAVMDRVLVFGTGGLAMSQIRASAAQVSVLHTVPLIGGSSTRTEVGNSSTTTWTKTGWALGGGIEVAISRSISLRGEYLHYSLGNGTVVVRNQANPTQSTSYRFSNSGDLFRLGVNTLF